MNGLPARATSTWRVSSLAASGASPSFITFMPRKMKPKPRSACPRLFAVPRRAKKLDREADADQQERELLHVEGEELHGEGGADVGAEDDAERLAEGDEPRRHEPDQHQGRRGRGLDERGDERARAHGGEAAPRHRW